MACFTSSFSFNFDQALAYTLSCLKQEGLTLKEEQIKAVELLSKGKDVFVWWEVHFVPELLPFVFDYKLSLTNAPLVERSVVLVVSLVVDQVRTLSSRGCLLPFSVAWQ